MHTNCDAIPVKLFPCNRSGLSLHIGQNCLMTWIMANKGDFRTHDIIQMIQSQFYTKWFITNAFIATDVLWF